MATLCCLDDTYNIDILQAHYGTTGEYIMATLIQDAILYGTEKPASLQRVIRRKQRKQKVKFRLDAIRVKQPELEHDYRFQRLLNFV